MKCVNKSLPEYKSLKEKTGLPDLVLSSIITEFQFKFKNDEFPSMGYINNRPSFNRDEQLKKFYDTDSGQTFWIGLTTKQKLELLKKYKEKYPSLDVRFERSYGNQYLKLVAYNKTVSEQVSKEAFMTLVNDLSKRLNIPYEMITKDSAKKILGNEYNGEPAFFYKGKVYFTEFSIEDPIHEFAHPFVRAIIKTNPDLFMNIMDEVIKEHPDVYDEVEKLYPEYFNEQGEVSLSAYEEMAVRAITKLGIGNIDTKTGKSVLQRLWDAILNFIQSIVGENIKIGDIKPNAKLKDLANLLTSFKGTINLETTPVKSGVQELFDSNTELASIGTPEQYSQYLDSIFPDSKVKDIVYHAASKAFDDKFLENKGGIHFTTSSFNANWRINNLLDYTQKDFNPRVIAAILNIKNANINISSVHSDSFQSDIIGGFDSVIGEERNTLEKGDVYSNYTIGDYTVKVVDGNANIAVKNSNQIHILGSKQDIDGFKIFVNKSQKSISSEKPMFNRTSQPDNISLEHSTALEYQKERLGDNLSQVQLNIAQKLINKKIKPGDNNYVEDTNEYTRATGYLKTLEGPNEQPSYYSFNEDDEGKYAEYREWGNQYDDLTQAVLMGYTFEEANLYVLNKHDDRVNQGGENIEDVSIPENVLKDVYDELINVISTELDGYLLLPQVIFKSEKNKIAGTADIVAISPDGKIKILDVKSSKVGFESFEYKREYKKDGVANASKFSRYKAQLSIYKAMAQEEGFVFEDNNELGIFNIHSLSSNNKTVDTVTPEGLFYLDGFQYIADKFTNNVSNTLSKKEIETIKKIKIALEEQLYVLQKNVNVKAGDFKKRELERFKEALSTIEQAKVLYSFVNETFKTFVQKELSDGKVFYGIKYNIRTLANKIEKGEVTGNDALQELYYYKSLVEIYSPIIENISAIFSYKDSPEMSSKIGEIIKAFNQIKSDYKTSAIPLIADILFEQVNPELNEKIKNFIDPIKKEVEELKQTKGVDSPEYKSKLKVLEKRSLKLKSEEGLTKESIIRTLEEGSLEDISTIDWKTSPAISSSNELVSLLAKTLKEKLENNRQKSIDLEYAAKKAFQDYVGDQNTFDPTKINEPFYEIVDVFTGKFDDTGQPIYEQQAYFISDVDHNKFEKNYAQAKAKSIEQGNKAGAYMKEWYRANMQLRPQEDVKVTNPYTGETIIIEKGLNTLLKEKIRDRENGIITESELESFKKSMDGDEEDGKVYYSNKDLLIPNMSIYKSNKVDSLSPKQKKYYNFLISTLLKSKNRTPVLRQNKFRLPSVAKQASERIFQNGVMDYIKYNISDTFGEMEEDIDRYGEKTSSGIKTVPILFSQKMNSADISKDLLRSVMLYDSASLIYEARTSTLPLAQSILDIAQVTPPLYRDSLSNKVANAFAKRAGIDNEFLKSDSNNVAKFLESWINTHIYGETNLKQDISIFGKKVALDKLADSLKSFASKTQIGGINPIGAVANSLQANVQLLIESHGGQYVNKKKITEGKAEYAKEMAKGEFIKDFNNGTPTSKIGQLAAIYDALQGEYLDKYGNKITATNARKLFSSDSWFFLHHQGEHEVQMSMMIAFLKSVEVEQNGNKINLYDAYELDKNGRIKLKDGVKLPGKKSQNGLISITVQNRLHALNKRMHGVYNSFDRPEIKKNLWGRLVFMYRDFVVPGFKKRYKTLGIDNELDDITEGYYTTFIRKVGEDYKKLARQLIGLEKNNLEDWEKANLRKALMEIGIVFTTGILVMLLTAMLKEADDDDKKYLKHLTFLTLKLNNEMGIYGTFGDPQTSGLPNVKEVWKTFKQPSAIIGTVDRFMNLLYQLLTSPGEEYKRDSGIWKKGDSKLFADFYKLIGITGTNVDPENAIKYIQMSSK